MRMFLCHCITQIFVLLHHCHLYRSKKLYYRVIDDAPRDRRPVEESTKRRWERRQYNSTNEAPPTAWADLWENSKGRRMSFLYPLSHLTGRYTRKALDLFLNIANKGGLHCPEMEIRKYELGEQDGVHACQTPQEALAYMYGTIAHNHVAVFRGVRLLGQRISESSAVQVKCIVPVKVIPAEEFIREHNLQMPTPPPASEGEMIDESEYEPE